MILAKDKLNGLLDALAASAELYIPKEISGVTRFALYASGDAPLLDHPGNPNTSISPKELVFPQCEAMYQYKTLENGETVIVPVKDETSRIVFGIRSCDMRAIDCLDDVFYTKGYVDEYYQARREHLLTVALGCTTPAESCFCDSMGLDPMSAPSADIQLLDAGDAYLVKAQTEKGEAALESWKPFLSDGEPIPLEAAPCTIKVTSDGIAQKLASLADSDELWDALSIKCLNCGACTFLCPTCYCFDIDQENRGHEGLRFRCWDSCMFAEYSEMAGGHNARPRKRDRVQNRFMHKLSFFEDRYGKMLCVGCGRCVSECPVALDITVLIDRIGELAHD